MRFYTLMHKSEGRNEDFIFDASKDKTIKENDFDLVITKRDIMAMSMFFYDLNLALHKVAFLGKISSIYSMRVIQGKERYKRSNCGKFSIRLFLMNLKVDLLTFSVNTRDANLYLSNVPEIFVPTIG